MYNECCVLESENQHKESNTPITRNLEKKGDRDTYWLGPLHSISISAQHCYIMCQAQLTVTTS